jgi:hypothetical protein
LDADNDGQACEEFFVSESPSDHQYGEEEVIVETIPKKKKLADTGGSALILPAGVLLLSAGLLLGRSVIRRVL